MITAIIFDFGDIFINLNPKAVKNAFTNLGLKQWKQNLDDLNVLFEKGQISEENFLKSIQKHIPEANLNEIKEAWNLILDDFPQYRLDFLMELSKKYRLFLLSNTDSIHISSFESKVGHEFSTNFYNCFEKVYFSFDLGMRKPDIEIYEFVLNENKLLAKNTLFVDDKKPNTDAAHKIGIKIWNLQVGKEDVVDLNIS